MEKIDELETQRKTRNIFDDDVSFDEAKKIILNDVSDNDFLKEEGIEVVEWNDIPVSENHSTSTTRPNLDNLGKPSCPTPGNTTKPAHLTNTSGIMSHSRSLSLTLGGPRSVGDSWKTFSPGDNLNRGVSDPSIEEVVGKQNTKTQLTAADIDKLQVEIQYLRRTNLLAKRDRFSKLPVKDTMKRMIMGEAYTFELYRSLEDKLLLLDQAIKMHDGNCIIVAVLFLKQTVKTSLFNLELTRRADAINHYLSYLRSNMDYKELANILAMLGRTEEAAMLQYKIAIGSSLGASKASTLRTVHRTHFSMDQQLTSESSLILEHIDLLERQLPVEESDANEEATGKNQIFRDLPRKRSIFDMPLITTVYYSCLYHYNLSENSLASPVAIKKRHQISDKQYLYCALGAQARLKNWNAIEDLLTSKGWFGGSKMKAVIGFDKVIEILHKNNVATNILQKYIACINDMDVRLTIAKKIKCHRAVIDVYVTLRDRSELVSYAAQFKHGSQDYFYANDALSNSVIKWK